MGKFIDITGQTFGKWYIIERDQNRKSHDAYWLCKCSCGNPEIKSVLGTNLRSGKSTSCGKCDQFELLNQRFGRLIIIELDLDYKKEHNIKAGSLYYKCKCDCGNTITVGINHLKNGNIRSCGCLAKEISSKVHSKDLTGQTFGKLTALYCTEKKHRNYNVWHCKCECGNECNVISENLLRGSTSSCGCISSMGEANIQRVLEKNGIKFEKEKKFNDCITKEGYQYRYDFYLPQYNRLIEFDGEQHFGYKGTGWDTKEKFERTQASDKIKNQYAYIHNIDLIRIPYTKRNNITLNDLLGNQYLIKGSD